MSALYPPGVLPLPGDQVLISERVAPLALEADVLTVRWTEPCDEPGWAHLTGTWTDGRAGRVMVWIERIVVRRSGDHADTGGRRDTPTHLESLSTRRINSA